jgi:hypothetical protein
MMKALLVPAVSGVAAFAVLAGSATASLPISVGNLVVVRFGDGSAPLTSQSTATFLEEFTTAGGAPVNTLAMPIAAAGPHFPFTNSGSASSEGFLTVSGSGSSSYLLLAGYGFTPGSVTTIVTTTSAAVPRIIARVDMNGVIDTTTALTDAYSGGNPRGACSDNGVQFWTAGTAGTGNGVRYATLGGTTSTQVNATLTNVRCADIYAGNLYCSSSSSAGTGYYGVAQVGTGLPTTVGNPTVALNGFPIVAGPSSYDFWFADATTLYVADDRTNGSGGIQKWVDMAGTWTNVYTLATSATVGCRGVTGTNVGGTITLYATTSQSSANTLVSVVDTGASSTFTVLATAAVNTKYQGVRIIPGSSSTPYTVFCAGDAVGSTCTGCGNNGGANRGCGNTVFGQGAQLTSSGVASTSADSLVLTCTEVTGPGLFFQANGLIAPISFGDGQLCAAIGIIRMGVVFPTGSTASYPGGLTPAPISVAGGPINPTDTKHYQCWYRDVPVFCTTATYNTSNGVSVTWQ